MTDVPETFTGPYSYLDMTFEEQNKALEINNPLKPGYVPAACYLIGTRGTVKLWTKPAGEVEQFSTPNVTCRECGSVMVEYDGDVAFCIKCEDPGT